MQYSKFRNILLSLIFDFLLFFYFFINLFNKYEKSVASTGQQFTDI
jgi:hypothetical protein